MKALDNELTLDEIIEQYYEIKKYDIEEIALIKSIRKKILQSIKLFQII
ncbi:hypothetical protein [Marinitoga lauensis]|nr:hypothetical protein [Marinitoga lauensis]